VGQSEQVERQYLMYRRMVLAMLHENFGGLPDHEELYQEAWAEALEMQARGEEILNLPGLLLTIAWRRGRDRLRKRKPKTVSPRSWLMLNQQDPGAMPDEQTEIRLDAALIMQVVETLDPRQAAVIKLRFVCHMDSREIQRELGVSPNRLEKIVTEAYRCVEEALAENEDGETEWRRRQRSLLLACESGLASAGQRRRARLMLRDDPGCRAMLKEIRSTLEHIAAILPLPLLVGPPAGGRLLQIRLGIADRLGTLRDQLADVAARIGGHSPSIEQAGVGGAASVGGGAALKLALTCFALTGTTVVCLTSGVLDGPHKPAKPHHKPSPRPEVTSRVIAPRAEPTTVVRRPVVVHRSAPVRREPPVARAAAPPPPAPAPAGSTEFGPGSVGSSPPPTTPAAAPNTGSGEFLP
jgi:RNA polymerase sigma factor (sigma-70 family)